MTAVGDTSDAIKELGRRLIAERPARYVTLPEPTFMGLFERGGYGSAQGVWLWIVAGVQFGVSFEVDLDLQTTQEIFAEAEDAFARLCAQVQEALGGVAPREYENGVAVIPEGGAFPKPVKREAKA